MVRRFNEYFHSGMHESRIGTDGRRMPDLLFLSRHDNLSHLIWNGMSIVENRISGGFRLVSKAFSATTLSLPMDETRHRMRTSSQAFARTICSSLLSAQSISASQEFFRRTKIRLVSHLGQYVPTSKKSVAFGGEPPIFTRVG